MVAILAVFTLLLVQLPAAVRCKLTPNSLAELHGLETNISIAWRDNDRVMFESGVNTALLAEIPDAIVSITSSATEALVEIFEKDPKKATDPNVPTDPRKISRLKRISAMKILTPAFAILSVVADVLSMTVFAENDQFEDIYTYLQDQFIKVNAKIEANFHAIKELESIVLCGQVSKNLRSRQTLVNSFYNRYKQMLERAKTDRGEAMAIFDTELPQYQSSLVLLELRQLLIDKSVYAQLLTYCARGDLMQYLTMMVELHHTFKQAIMLDAAAKIRLFNLTKDVLESDRGFWRNQSALVVDLMTEVGLDLAISSWHSFYVKDVDKSLSKTVSFSGQQAANDLNSALVTKYFYVRTAVIVVPYDSQSIDVTDAFGQDMQTVSADSFVCYRRHRAFGETVIVLCRNVFVYPDEQADIDSAYATYTRGVLSLSLVDALRNDRWDDIGSVMNTYQVSFFAVRVVVYLNSGEVATAQSSAASDLAFFQSEGTAFQALVTAKLVRGSPSAVNKVVPPAKVKANGAAIAGLWPAAPALTLASILIMKFY